MNLFIDVTLLFDVMIDMASIGFYFLFSDSDYFLLKC